MNRKMQKTSRNSRLNIPPVRWQEGTSPSTGLQTPQSCSLLLSSIKDPSKGSGTLEFTGAIRDGDSLSLFILIISTQTGF